ncbi:MAG: hypothetical protein EZS28_004351 [Streblomastix strix]|uniref:Uncharacterized protein n=1 Tax=Streblomastix strix TaxID=222440 RepID=A0A5J4X044_9EUKA|nr:MAG: hypothetical protein EZS28_004351 [Streblomastix strix]
MQSCNQVSSASQLQQQCSPSLVNGTTALPNNVSSIVPACCKSAGKPKLLPSPGNIESGIRPTSYILLCKPFDSNLIIFHVSLLLHRCVILHLEAMLYQMRIHCHLEIDMLLNMKPFAQFNRHKRLIIEFVLQQEQVVVAHQLAQDNVL